MANNINKWSSPGGHWVSSWVWMQQLVTVFCWLPGCSWALHMETCHHFCDGLGTWGASVPPELELSKQESRFLTLVIRTKKHHTAVYGGPLLCTSQLRMLRMPVTVMLPAWYGQGLTLFSLAQSSASAVHCSGSAVTGMWHHCISIFWRSWDVRRWQCVSWLPPIQRFDSGASSSDVCGAFPAL